VVSLTLPGTLSNGHYSLNYYKNANEISGVFGGKGTLVFEKNVKVTGDVVYLNGSSRMVYIVNGNLDIDKTVNQIDGFWYVTGQIKAKGTTNTLYVGRGALFSGTDIMSDRPINVTFDNAFWVDRVEAQRHCVPGFWPTPETGIMR
jgi:cytoskeletal protein CcmA (bactofilin family)